MAPSNLKFTKDGSDAGSSLGNGGLSISKPATSVSDRRDLDGLAAVPGQPARDPITRFPTTVGSNDVVPVNGMAALAVTLFSYEYGNLVVAQALPSDPRTDSWLMVKSPIPTLALSLFYVVLVTWLGPRFMRDRKPFQLRGVMIAYNIFQVVFSFYMFYESGVSGWLTTYSWRCQLCDFSNSPQAIRMLNVAYWYYISKFIDFFDTIFFVLHKKYEHVSLLHVIHHSCMPISVWYGVKYLPGGHTTLFGFLNTFVHGVMYSYYLLAAMGPSVRPFLWWKKYLTTLQIVQFVIIALHSAQLLFITCSVPKAVVRWVAGYAFMFLCLFINFYIKAYLRRSHTSKQATNRSTFGIPGIVKQLSFCNPDAISILRSQERSHNVSTTKQE